MVRTVVSPAGTVEVQGSTVQVASIIGEAAGTLVGLQQGDAFILVGYLSQVPSNSTAPIASGFVSSGAVYVQGVNYVLSFGDSVNLTFANDMSTASFPAGTTARMIVNAQGTPANVSIPLQYVFDPVTRVARLLPVSGDWPAGGYVEILVSTNTRDFNGVPLTQPATHYVAIARDPAAENRVISLNDPAVAVEVPAGTFNAPYSIAVSTGLEGDAMINRANLKAAAIDRRRRPMKIVRLDPLTTTGSLWSSPLAKDVRIQVPYPDSNGDGNIDNWGNARAKKLALWRLDEKAELWVRQPAATFNTGLGAMSLASNHFSVYAVMPTSDQDTSDAFAFPVPFRPNAGDSRRYGDWATGIRFAGLPNDGTVEIYTITGELVRRLDIATSPLTWDVRNTHGRVVASGLYLWQVRSGPNSKRGKLVVIR